MAYTNLWFHGTSYRPWNFLPPAFNRVTRQCLHKVANSHEVGLCLTCGTAHRILWELDRDGGEVGCECDIREAQRYQDELEELEWKEHIAFLHARDGVDKATVLLVK